MHHVRLRCSCTYISKLSKRSLKHLNCQCCEGNVFKTDKYDVLFRKHSFNPKRAGGGRNPPPLRHFLLYLCRLLFFRAETSWLFSFKPCARFKSIFIKIGHRVMRRRCVIAGWVQRKNWFSIEITHKSCFLSFLSFRIHFHYVLSYLFGLFGVRTCVSILWHTSLPKNATFAWKNSEKPWFWPIFGDFRVFGMTSLMTSLWRHTRYVLNFFGTNGLGRVIAIH